MTKDETLILIKKYFKRSPFTEGELDVVAKVLELVIPFQFENILRESVESGVRLTIPNLKAKINFLRFGDSAAPEQATQEPDCEWCLGVGFCTVRVHGTQESGEILVKCSCHWGAKCVWDLPVWRDSLSNIAIRIHPKETEQLKALSQSQDPIERLGLYEKVNLLKAKVKLSVEFWKGI